MESGSERGFTILELMVAIVVLILLVPAAFGTYELTQKAYVMAEIQGKGEALARQEAEKVKAIRYSSLEALLEGNPVYIGPVVDLGEGFSCGMELCRIYVNDNEAEGIRPDILEVTNRLIHQSGRDFSLTFLVTESGI